MTHFYEKNIVEIKNEYTTFIVNIITPVIYEGLKSIYNYSIDTHKVISEKRKTTNGIDKNLSILKIFQTCLKELPTLNNHLIDGEVERIRVEGKCSDFFDDLVKAVIKIKTLFRCLIPYPAHKTSTKTMWS